MNRIKLLSCCLTLLVGVAGHAGERLTAEQRGVDARAFTRLESEVKSNAAARAYLEAQVHSYQYALKHIWRPWGSTYRAMLAKGIATLNDTLLCPPLRTVCAHSDGWGRLLGAPVVATLCGMYCLERSDYAAYMQKRRELIDLSCKVEHLHKWLLRKQSWYCLDQNDKSVMVTIQWFFDEGFNQANEHYMFEVISKLDKSAHTVLVQQDEKPEHKHRG